MPADLLNLRGSGGSLTDPKKGELVRTTVPWDMEPPMKRRAERTTNGSLRAWSWGGWPRRGGSLVADGRRHFCVRNGDVKR